MKGSGAVARQIGDTIALARAKYLKNKKMSKLDNSHYLRLKYPQLKLF